MRQTDATGRLNTHKASSLNNFVIISEDAGKHYRVQILDANLFVRKLTATDDVVTAIERVLVAKSPARYKYTEIIPKTFVVPRGQRSWKHEDIFQEEPVRRIALAFQRNVAFTGSNDTNPFHYRKFDLTSITISRNGIPVQATPLSTVDNKRIYYNSLDSLAFGHTTSHLPIILIILCWRLT